MLKLVDKITRVQLPKSKIIKVLIEHQIFTFDFEYKLHLKCVKVEGISRH